MLIFETHSSLTPELESNQDQIEHATHTVHTTQASHAGHPFTIVLVNPQIPGNTGSIGRTCVALNIPLILIGDCGFRLDEKSVRRAGLDYWKHVNLKYYKSVHEFLETEKVVQENLFFFSRFATSLYYDAPFQKGCYLIFGSETSGLPKEIFDQFPTQFYALPSYSTHIRSLNLANTATAVAFEALRKINFI